ncbi:MAG: response regulator transcription factor [Desulfamplus sp.]|nr:response regulator transcription factor [Desulfamplus sp.]
MKKKTQIVLVEDHEIVRQGFRALLSSVPDMEIIGEADNGIQAVRCIAELKPDLVFLDLSLPKRNGICVIEEIRKSNPFTKFIVLTAHNTDEHVHACFHAGASGFVSKSASFNEIEMAIKSVVNGKTFISPDVSSKVIDGYLDGKKKECNSTRLSTLTKREKEVLILVAEGYKNKEIADTLFISLKTVERHRANLMKKLDIHNSSALTSYAIQNKLISPDSLTPLIYSNNDEI